MPSPIETLIDKACGREPGAEQPQDTKPIATPTDEELTAHSAALLEIAAAAKAWDRSAPKGTKRLKAAVKAWRAIGG